MWQFWDSGGVKLESLWNFSIVGYQWTVNCLLGIITVIHMGLIAILARFEAKIAKIHNIWTFRLVIQQIKHLFQMRQKAFLPKGP